MKQISKAVFLLLITTVLFIVSGCNFSQGVYFGIETEQKIDKPQTGVSQSLSVGSFTQLGDRVFFSSGRLYVRTEVDGGSAELKTWSQPVMTFDGASVENFYAIAVASDGTDLYVIAEVDGGSFKLYKSSVTGEDGNITLPATTVELELRDDGSESIVGLHQANQNIFVSTQVATNETVSETRLLHVSASGTVTPILSSTTLGPVSTIHYDSTGPRYISVHGTQLATGSSASSTFNPIDLSSALENRAIVASTLASDGDLVFSTVDRSGTNERSLLYRYDFGASDFVQKDGDNNYFLALTESSVDVKARAIAPRLNRNDVLLVSVEQRGLYQIDLNQLPSTSDEISEARELNNSTSGTTNNYGSSRLRSSTINLLASSTVGSRTYVYAFPANLGVWHFSSADGSDSMEWVWEEG